MFKKLVDVLKEVFWLKPSKTPKHKPRKTALKPPKKAIQKPATQTKKQAPAKRSKALKKIKTPALKPVSPPKEKKPLKTDLDPSLTPVGSITHYFDRIKVAVLKIDQGSVLIGDRLTMVTGKTKFVQKIWSMQIESQDVKVARKGQLIGIKVDKPVAPGDIVYK